MFKGAWPQSAPTLQVKGHTFLNRVSVKSFRGQSSPFCSGGVDEREDIVSPFMWHLGSKFRDERSLMFKGYEVRYRPESARLIWGSALKISTRRELQVCICTQNVSARRLLAEQRACKRKRSTLASWHVECLLCLSYRQRAERLFKQQRRVTAG